ncbi:MAG TPA: zf-HC2 domain-containing protein [Longimicrobium sp.]|nr:zf-HC2 domain-containing protein [Longimicrobium sp.]
MTHEQAIERLDDYASGELPDIERRLMERHLESCGECRAEVEAIRALLADVAKLPTDIAPPADLWQGIAGRLEPRESGAAPRVEDDKVIPLAPRRKKFEPPRWALQAAAAVVLMVGSSLVTAKLIQRQQAAGPVATLPAAGARAPGQGTARGVEGTVPTSPDARPAAAPAAGGSGQVTALAAFRPAEREYQQAVDDLARVLETRRASLAPETVATLERNLAIIDAAIAESRAALVNDPNSRELTEMLSSTYDAKVQLLRQAVQL